MTLLLVIAFALAISAAAHELELQGLNDDEACSMRDPLMDPTFEVLHGQNTVWQIPSNPKAIIFLAHGARANPFPYFDQGPKCELCFGMPEERSIVLEALRRGYAVISVKSLGTSWDWENPDTCEDLPVVMNILNDWRRQHSLEGLPLAAYGVSAGGFFATILAVKVPSIALILMSSEGHTELVENAIPGIFPPPFFVYMGRPDESVTERRGGSQLSRDMTTAAEVERSIAILTERGVRVAWKHIVPSQVTPLFFSERVPCITHEISKQIQGAYKAEGWLDEDNNLVVDPYSRDWQVPLRKWNALPSRWDSVPSPPCFKAPICYELVRAYAVHGTSGDANGEVFPWMDSIVMSSDNRLWRPISSSR